MTMTIDHALGRKLERFARLSEEDHRALRRLREAPLREVEPRADLIAEGDEPAVVRLSESGWACRYKHLPNGRRQIVGLFVPGDFCDLNVYILRHLDHSIGAISKVRYYALPPHMIEELVHDRPRIGKALLWNELVQASIQREWLLTLGQRNARERLANLFVEMFHRVRSIGLAGDGKFEFPLTQTDLADTTGMTPVHTNRTIQELRQEGLIDMDRRHLGICDLAALSRLAMFNAGYLHLDREGETLDAAN
ncbi:Crp/Fnr family transcriptional regulator [Croceicoccus mobilis]|nr:Crp/Fnr family transcriptional regulator [Croceicoccus mobilis]